MLAGKPCDRWQHLWNVVDVRDVAEAQALILESPDVANESRFLLAAADQAGELDANRLQAHLRWLFPDIDVGGGPPEMHAMIDLGLVEPALL